MEPKTDQDQTLPSGQKQEAEVFLFGSCQGVVVVSGVEHDQYLKGLFQGALGILFLFLVWVATRVIF